MAFNPMRGFRKHQKAWFAGLTILCMFNILIYRGIGAGSSILESLGLMIGARSRGDVVASLYGKEIVARQIVDIRMQRRLANQYMDSITNAAREETIQSVKDATRKWNDSEGQIVQGIIRMRENSFRSRQDRFRYLQDVQGILKYLADQRTKLLQAKKPTEATLIEDLNKSLQKELEREF